jgi:hypothetical protein
MKALTCHGKNDIRCETVPNPLRDPISMPWWIA